MKGDINPNHILDNEPLKNIIREAQEKAITYSTDPYLLNHIHNKLKETHLGDILALMTAFITTITGFLFDSSDHKSVDFRGDTTTGKTNVMKTILSNLPRLSWEKVTRATQSTLEDDIPPYVKIVAFEEVNLRKGGANSELVEIIKQLTEGGVYAVKKDASNKFKTAKRVIREQTTVLCSTTDVFDDAERETRFLQISIVNDPIITQKVVNHSLKYVSNINRYQDMENSKHSWISFMISNFKYNKVILPFANKLENLEFFKNINPRTRRDIKRLLSLSCAISFLFQNQRTIIKIHNDEIIIGEPIDFLNALIISADFFYRAYDSVDPRLEQVAESVEKLSEEIELKDIDSNEFKIRKAAARHHVEKDLGVSRNTIKQRIKDASQLGLISYVGKKGNSIYYQKCQLTYQKGVKGININDVLKNICERIFDNFDTSKHFIDTLKENKITVIQENNSKMVLFGEGINISKEYEDRLLYVKELLKSSKIDTFELTPSKIPWNSKVLAVKKAIFELEKNDSLILINNIIKKVEGLEISDDDVNIILKNDLQNHVFEPRVGYIQRIT